MLDITYNALPYSVVQDLTDLYKQNLPEMKRFKSVVETTKMVFGLPANRIIVEVAEGARIYKITLLSTDVNKVPFGYLVYIPLDKRIDIYSMSSPYIPVLQWKNKKVVYSSLDMFFTKSHAESLYKKIIDIA